MPTLYDQVPYRGAPFAQTHPDRLAMLAHLFGMKPAPVERCRVLELGCTDGGNLIPMAMALPDSEFIGIDLAERAIDSGRKTICDLALANIDLRAGDLMEVGPDWGRFDFIIAHGVYSWVPPAVRDQILRITKQNLAPEGVAYVSYNAHPGGHLRRMVREMMLYHVRGIEEATERITRARSLITLLVSQTREHADDYRGFLRKELEGILERDPNVLFHDELAEVWEPVFFHEFMSRAAAHGLQFLSEANYADMQDGAFDGPAVEMLESLGEDRIAREQYRDFLKCRRFRQTLLCHEEVTLDAEPSGVRIQQLYAASPAKIVAEQDGVKTIEGPHGSSMKTAHPVVIRIMERLIEAWPRALHFEELLEHVGRDHRTAQCEILLATFAAGLVQLHMWRPVFSLIPGERPVASPLARLQAGFGFALTTLRHTTVEAKGRVERKLITLLDGTRDLEALRRELGDDASQGQVEDNLLKAARLGLLL